MKSLHEILSKYHDNKQRDILFEDGEWCIYRRLNDRCYIIHRCGKVNKAQNPMANKCHGCGEVTPEALKGLFKLNEWRR